MIELEARYGGRRHFEQCTRDAFYHRIRRMERILREADVPFALLARYQGGLVQIVARR